MRILQYGDHNWRQLPRIFPNRPGILPRVSRYNEDSAYELGLTPIGSQNTVEPIAWKDLKESIQTARDKECMPIYHQYYRWAKKGKFRSNQGNLNFCWAWSATASMMDLRAVENKETVMLSPVSLGWLVNWKNRGYYLDATINGLCDVGIAPASYIGDGFNSTNRNSRLYKSGWETQRSKYRLSEVWDIDTSTGDRRSILQAAAILCSGRPIYLAYNWWSHALMCTGMKWDESKKNNVIWQIRNSHNENDVIEMDGNRAVPDEMYGFVSSVLA